MATIVIIEDNALMRVTIKQMLRRDGYEILEAADGPAGIALVRSARPDLIILDLMMPFMSGDEVARYLRYEPDLASIPIIVLTALNQTDMVLDLLSLQNVRDYYLKPVDLVAFRQRVKALLSTSAPAAPEPDGLSHIGAQAGDK